MDCTTQSPRSVYAFGSRAAVAIERLLSPDPMRKSFSASWNASWNMCSTIFTAGSKPKKTERKTVIT
eukprot:5974622-Pyramimonas_sp.AAC.1